MTDLAAQVTAGRRILAAREARENLLAFMKFTMPDPEAPGDPLRSRYEETPLARLLCGIMQKVFTGEMRRVCVSVGPQMGKSQITSRGAPAWIMGADPTRNIILGTYNQDFADEFGDATRDIMQSDAYRQVFGRQVLRTGGRAKDLLITHEGGRAAFVGRGGSGTGKPGDIFIVDDPLKDDMEAQSDATRAQVWNWFTKVAMTRCHAKSAIVVVHTRWHLDDLIGRLADPEHPERNKALKGIADQWTYLNLAAIIDEPKLARALGLSLEPPTDPFVISMFGSKPMSSIWPGRKSLRFLAEAKQMDPVGFSALNMGRPTPEDGDYFKADWLVGYEKPGDLPKNLTIFAASDHAISQRQQADYTVMGCVGVDESDDIWVLPDLIWTRESTDAIVEDMLTLMRRHNPSAWWLESDVIAKSFGPFLFKRMSEDRVYTMIDDASISKDKLTRARALQGRMAMHKVHFPIFASWWPDARAQLLNFPNGAHDDFVDFLAHIGRGLLKQHKPSPEKVETNVIQVGSIGWILRQAKRRASRVAGAKALRDW